MKKVINHFAALLLMSAAFMGCSEDIAQSENPENPNTPITLVAAMDGGADTRVAFDHPNITQALALTWKEGDKFTVYNAAGTRVGNFVLKSGAVSKNGVFEKDETFTMPNGTYTALYPQSTRLTLAEAEAAIPFTGLKQTAWSDLSHLDMMLHMQSTFEYAGATETQLQFKHQRAIVAVSIGYTFPAQRVKRITVDEGADGTPADLELFDYTGTWANNYAYLMLPPSSGSRDVTFTVTTILANGSEGVEYQKKVNTPNPHEAGKFYPIVLSDNFIRTNWKLSQLTATNYPTEDSWTITDAAASEAAFTGLRAALADVLTKNNARRITLSFPNLTAVPDRALSSQTNVTSVSIPVATAVGAIAFYNMTALTTVTMPKVATIGNYAFQDCKALTSVPESKITAIPSFAFDGCTELRSISQSMSEQILTIGQMAFGSTSLTEINFPKVTTVGGQVFVDCAQLATVDLPMVTNVGIEAFTRCSLTAVTIATKSASLTLPYDAFSGVDLTKTTLTTGRSNGTTVNGNIWTVNNNTYTFKSIIQLP